jgi:hypothetical protein
MASDDLKPINRSLEEIHAELERHAVQMQHELDALAPCEAVNEETRAAIKKANDLNERTVAQLAELEQRIADFKRRLGQNHW